jgi:Reverse transcriptase (RNA-dependent DNA polymerase)
MAAQSGPNHPGGSQPAEREGSGMVLQTPRRPKVRELHRRVWELDADIRDFFSSIDHQLLIEKLMKRVSDRKLLKLLRKWLGAGVMEEGVYRQTVAGTPQGGVISPLLSIIYVHPRGNRFRTGNAANRFIEIDRYVAWRLRGLLVRRHGRKLRAGQADAWTRQWFGELGLRQLMGTDRYPGAA